MAKLAAYAEPAIMMDSRSWKQSDKCITTIIALIHQCKSKYNGSEPH